MTEKRNSYAYVLGSYFTSKKKVERKVVVFRLGACARRERERERERDREREREGEGEGEGEGGYIYYSCYNCLPFTIRTKMSGSRREAYIYSQSRKGCHILRTWIGKYINHVATYNSSACKIEIHYIKPFISLYLNMTTLSYIYIP